MSMNVTANADGSYTVSCDGVAVTVGGGVKAATGNKQDDDDFDAGQQKGPFLLPPRPKPNDPGPVVANLHVGRDGASRRPFGRAAERDRLTFEGVNSLVSRVDEFLSSSRRPIPSGQRVRVLLALTQQDELDLEFLYSALAEIATRHDVRIEVDIAVQAGRSEPAPM